MQTTPAVSSFREQLGNLRKVSLEENLTSNPAFQVTKQAKRKAYGSVKLTHLTLHILASEDGFVINFPGASEMKNDGTSKYPRRQKVSELATVIRAASGSVLHFRSKLDPDLVLDFHSVEACDICCRILFAANKLIEFLDEGETWRETGKIVEYAAQAGRRNQGSVTSRIGAAFSGSKVILRLHLLEKRLELVWGSRKKRYDASELKIQTNWTVQSKFPTNPLKAKLLVPSLDYSSGVLDMDFYFPSPGLKLRFCGHLRAAMIPNVDIIRLRRSGLELCGVRGPELRVWCGTWNCGDTPSPGSEELSKWIDVTGKFDVYAIGFQECDAKGFKQWVADCKGTFDSSGFAVDEICSISLWGIHLIVLIKRSILRFVSDVRTDSVACGFANIAGNKGGVGCAFCFNESMEVAFINSHLAARAKRVQERGDDYKNIAGGMKNLLSHRGTDFLHQMRHVFWMGDLNYRINIKNGSGMDTQGEYEEVLRVIAAKNYGGLYEHDQLLHMLKRNNGAFQFFNEGKIKFAPTYRMNKNETGYSNKRFQSPSWTDRVLVRSVCGYGSKIKQLSYVGHHDILQSDHRPVSATYAVATNMPYVNLSASTSVVNREKCDILLSDLCVELQDPDSLAAHIAEEEAAESSVDQVNPLVDGKDVEEESFEFSGGRSSTASHEGGQETTSEKKKKKKKKGFMSKIFGGTVKMSKKAITTVKGVQRLDKKNSAASMSSGKQPGRGSTLSTATDDSEPGRSGVELNLRFSGDTNFLATPVSSETIVVPKNGFNGTDDTKNMEAEWHNDLIPSIVPLAGDVSYVQSQSMLITVRMRRPEDAVFHKIGCAEISLSPGASSLPRMSIRGGSGGGASSSAGRSAGQKKTSRKSGRRQESMGAMEQQFVAPLICHGVQSGFIRGTVRLRSAVQPASSSMSKRWRRRSDIAFTSMTKKKFENMSKKSAPGARDSDDMRVFDKFSKQRERAGGGDGGGGSGGVSSGSTNIESTTSVVSSTSSTGRLHAWGGMDDGMDDLDAWLAGDDDEEEEDEDEVGDTMRDLPDVMNDRPLRVLKKSYSLDVQSTIQPHKKLPLHKPMAPLFATKPETETAATGSSNRSLKKTRPPPAPKF